MIELVVFDMAGTVIDEQNLVYRTLHQTIVQSGYDISYPDVLAIAAGKEKKQAIEDLILFKKGISDKKIIDLIYFEFKVNLQGQYATAEIQKMTDADYVFYKLRELGIFIVLNTGYDRKTAELLLQLLEWKEGIDFDLLITASDVAKGRPAPDMIDEAIDHFHIHSPDHVMKVGDSMVDIEEGKNVHCKYVIGVTTGAHTRQQLDSAQPTHIVDSLNEIIPIINGQD